MKRTKKRKYCKRHDQRYNAYLTRCPICVGEEIWETEKKRVKFVSDRVSMLGKRKAITTRQILTEEFDNDE